MTTRYKVIADPFDLAGRFQNLAYAIGQSPTLRAAIDDNLNHTRIVDVMGQYGTGAAIFRAAQIRQTNKPGAQKRFTGAAYKR